MPDRLPPKTSTRATGRTSFSASELAHGKELPSKDRKSFSASDLKRDAPLRDKDNATPQIPKPRDITLDHPRLAPPGMSGIKIGDRAPGLARTSARPKPDKNEPVHHQFKAIASDKKADKDRSFER